MFICVIGVAFFDLWSVWCFCLLWPLLCLVVCCLYFCFACVVMLIPLSFVLIVVFGLTCFSCCLAVDFSLWVLCFGVLLFVALFDRGWCLCFVTHFCFVCAVCVVCVACVLF